MTIDERNAAQRAALEDPSFANLARAMLAKASYLDAIGDTAEGKDQIDLYNAATRCTAEAVKAMRHAAKDEYRELAARLDAERKIHSRFGAAVASVERRH